jgi:integrase
MILSNPCQIKGAAVERSAERPIPSVDDLRRISAAMPDRLALAPWIAGLAGLRKGELLGLARRHIDLGADTIRVERALQEQTGVGAVFVEPPPVAGGRNVGMPGALVPLVERHLAQYVADRPDALVFTNTHGRPVRATIWAAAWNDARKATGLHALRLHDLRHLAGTLTAQAGATTREVMDRLGHSSVDAAMRYQHVAEQRRSAVARRIDDLL